MTKMLKVTPFILFLLLLICNYTVAQSSSLTWDIQTISSEGTIGASSLALDSADNPHICYSEHPKQDHTIADVLVYAHWNGTAWSTQKI
ncbi:MAG: BNR repeat-containing protein, partial [Candidatus Bathyarchaeota archaeon]|nr:BNR repeat-containing protein [Candidatus Bathyarchaeota archaeon]